MRVLSVEDHSHAPNSDDLQYTEGAEVAQLVERLRQSEEGRIVPAVPRARLRQRAGGLLLGLSGGLSRGRIRSQPAQTVDESGDGRGWVSTVSGRRLPDEIDQGVGLGQL